MIWSDKHYAVSEQKWKKEECPQSWLFICAEALLCVSTGTTASVVLTVPHVDEVLAEMIAGVTSEDDMEFQLLWCFRAEVEENCPQLWLSIYAESLLCVSTGTTASVVLTERHS